MTDKRPLLRSWLYAMSRLEVELRLDQGRARNAMIRKAASEYEKLHHPPAHVFASHRQRTRHNVEDHYRRTIPVFAAMAVRQVNSAAARSGKSRRIERKDAQSIFESLVQQWIKREALRKAQLIAEAVIGVPAISAVPGRKSDHAFTLGGGRGS